MRRPHFKKTLQTCSSSDHVLNVFERVFPSEWLLRASGAPSDALNLAPQEKAMEMAEPLPLPRFHTPFSLISNAAQSAREVWRASKKMGTSPSAVLWALNALELYLEKMTGHASTTSQAAMTRMALNAIAAIEVARTDASAQDLITQIENILPPHHLPMDADSLWGRRRAYLHPRQAQGWPQVLTDVADGQLRMPVYF